MQRTTSDFVHAMEARAREGRQELDVQNLRFVNIVAQRKQELTTAMATLIQRSRGLNGGAALAVVPLNPNVQSIDLPDTLIKKTAHVLSCIALDNITSLSQLTSSLRVLQREILALEHLELAAKVLALVPLPQKKLLNFSHDWLCTFLPHCMAKVNRVSFGLLTEMECRQAVKKEPNMPRSRLKLAVPFLGKGECAVGCACAVGCVVGCAVGVL